MPVVRHRQRRGGAAGERGLTSRRPVPSSEDPGGLLRPALELAWAVARAGEQLKPAVAAPRPLRPLLHFARLPARALDVVRRVVDEDADFRSRVVAAAEQVELSRPAWLFVARPEGWADELEELMAEARTEAEDRRGDRDRRDVVRRVRAAEEAAKRAEDALAVERERAVRTAEELRAERRSRRAAEQDAASARRSVESLRVSQAKARRALEEASAELARLRASSDDAPDLGVLAKEISDAAEAAASLASALRSTAEALGMARGEISGAAPGGSAEARGGPFPADREVSAPSPTPPDRGGSSPNASEQSLPPPAPRAPPQGRRRPAPLPPGLRDDTPEAAEHLVRLDRAVLVVDGYNASLAWRPHLPIAEQRRRLVDALEELAARTQSDVEVVFDGAEPEQPVRSTGSRRLVRVRFSPPDVEADEIVVGLVGDFPWSRPVVVASNDRQVQEGAKQRGANAISVAQLMAVLRRER